MSNTDILGVAQVQGRISAAHNTFVQEAEAGERLRRPTPRATQTLCETGIFELLLPRSLGGLDATPIDILAVIEELAYHDASLGWLARTIVTNTGLAGTYLPQEAIDELFDAGKPLVGGHATNYTGTAQVTDGGYLVSGDWHFAPGTSVATHLNLGVQDEDGHDLVCVVPRSAVWLVDNWDMLGLRATASLDYSVRGQFVPSHMTFRITRSTALRGSCASSLSPALMAALHQSAWSQGVGRRMLDELCDLAQSKDPEQGAPVTTDEFYAEFARHYSHVRGTMALLRQTWGDIEAAQVPGSELGDDLETMARLASSLATRTTLEIAQLVHRFAGARVMGKGVLQRYFRDSHAGTQHRGASSVVTSQCGRMLTSTLPAGTKWGFFELMYPEEGASGQKGASA